VEDLVADTIVMAIRNQDSFENGTNMKSWLFKIETGIFQNMRRRERTRASCEDRFQTSDSDVVMAVVGESSPQHVAVELADVTRIIDGLPEDQKAALYLVCFMGYSPEDAAQILDCKLGTLYTRISRARSAVINELNGVDPPTESVRTGFHP